MQSDDLFTSDVILRRHNFTGQHGRQGHHVIFWSKFFSTILSGKAFSVFVIFIQQSYEDEIERLRKEKKEMEEKMEREMKEMRKKMEKMKHEADKAAKVTNTIFSFSFRQLVIYF